MRRSLQCMFKILLFSGLVALTVLILKGTINSYLVSTYSNNSVSAKLYFLAETGISFVNFLKPSFKTVPTRDDLIYVLIWTDSRVSPVYYLKKNTDCFVERKCSFQNCYVTDNRNYLGNYSKFDVILFTGPQLDSTDLPKMRMRRQIYVYGNIESADYYPLCDTIYDNYFNWTWTYKLDSTLRWGYIVITNIEGVIIGPKKEMNWIKQNDMRSVDNNLKQYFKTKSKAVAWFVSHCYTLSRREKFAKKLSNELQVHNLTLDIYGSCGFLKCEDNRENGRSCNEILEKDYFFYLSFENAISEDYVTEKILIPLQYNAIPIVLGGANYTRFLPDGSYLDANKLGARNLAAQINRLISYKEEYYEYFRWKYHYKYFRKNDNPATDDYCEFCAALNNKEYRNKTKIQRRITKWWSKPTDCLNHFPDFAKRFDSHSSDAKFIRLKKEDELYTVVVIWTAVKAFVRMSSGRFKPNEQYSILQTNFINACRDWVYINKKCRKLRIYNKSADYRNKF